MHNKIKHLNQCVAIFPRLIKQYEVIESSNTTVFGLEAGHSHLVPFADRQTVADSFHLQAVVGRMAVAAGDSHLAGSHPVNNTHI